MIAELCVFNMASRGRWPGNRGRAQEQLVVCPKPLKNNKDGLLLHALITLLYALTRASAALRVLMRPYAALEAPRFSHGCGAWVAFEPSAIQTPKSGASDIKTSTAGVPASSAVP